VIVVGCALARVFLSHPQMGKKTTFVVAMGDIVTDVDLSLLVEEHRRSGALASIGLKRVEDVSQFGVVCLNNKGYVEHFQEKPMPHEALSDLANIGIYVFDSDIFKYMPDEGCVYVWQAIVSAFAW
jgi:NDP-sugar pyrophosphorylase family protein